MTHRVQGTAFITGAGSGIGAGVALKLAFNGISRLSLVDVDHVGLQKVQDELKAKYPDVKVWVHQVDVTNEESVTRVVQETAEECSRIDIAVNAAGIGDVMLPTHQVTLGAWRRILEVNQSATWLCERAAIKAMLKQESYGFRLGRGVIINVASALGLVPSATGLPFPSYSAAKHAVVGFTKMDAKFYASHEIRINSVCPGWVRTPMIQQSLDTGLLTEEIQSAPAGRVGELEEVTDAILFLASPMSSFMYGSTLVVDGGYSL